MSKNKDKERMSIFEFIETMIKLVCTIVLLAIIGVLLLQRFSNNDKAVGGIRVFNVATGSMVPVYKIGDIILVKEVDTNTLKEGDPISYLGKEKDYAGKVITHRIKKIEDTAEGKIFHTQGDATSVEDPPIKADQIYGKVVYKFILISYLSKLMLDMKAFYMFVFLPLGLLVFLQFKDNFTSRILEEKDRSRQEDDDDDEDDDEEDEDDEDDDEDDEDDDK